MSSRAPLAVPSLVCLAALGCGSAPVPTGVDGGDVDGAPDAQPPIDAALSLDARAPVTPAVVTTAPFPIQSLWADGEAVYWASADTVSRWDVNTEETIDLATGEVAPLGLLGDGTWLYWTVGAVSGPGTAAVRRTPDDSAAAVDFVGGQEAPYFLARDGVDLFWTDYTGAVLAAPLDDGVPVRTLADGLPQTTGIAATTDWVYYEVVGAFPRSLQRIAKTGGSPIPITTSTGLNGVIAANADTVFWIEGQSLRRLAENESGMMETAVTETALLRAAAVAGEYVYWIVAGSSGNALLRRMPIAGGVDETIALGFDASAYTEIRAGGGNVYWFSGAEILSAPR